MKMNNIAGGGEHAAKLAKIMARAAPLAHVCGALALARYRRLPAARARRAWRQRRMPRLRRIVRKNRGDGNNEERRRGGGWRKAAHRVACSGAQLRVA